MQAFHGAPRGIGIWSATANLAPGYDKPAAGSRDCERPGNTRR